MRIFRLLLAWIDAAMAKSAILFMDNWSRIERAYRRPFSRLSFKLKFAYYPLLACAAVGWLAWDWTHTRSLDAAEDAIFDKVVRWRPWEPAPSGRVIVVEIDECSIDHFRSRGEGGWPWSRQRHADLLDALDRGGVAAVGYDVLFVDPSPDDPQGDATLEAMAEGGAGRFVFASDRLHRDYDEAALLRMASAPSAFPLIRPPRDNPQVAMQLPYGKNMRRYSALANVTRNQDGMLRDIPLREDVGDWALASLPLQTAIAAGKRIARPPAATLRPNWRRDSRLPHVSAADLLTGEAICREKGSPALPLRGRIAMVGYTASGLNDAKPTPVDPIMPGVDVLAEATEALVAGSAIRMPPTWLKYLLAGVLVLLTAFAFWRGEPHEDVDSIFVATNLLLLLIAFVGLSFFGVFFDIFASLGFVSLNFGLCRLYAGVQRGRAVGNADYLAEYDAGEYPWLAMARLRFVPDPRLDKRAAKRRRREYRRRLRRFLYAGCDAVMIEGIVERKSWLHDILDDLMVLVWKGRDREQAHALAQRELDALYRYFNEQDERLDDDGSVLLCVVAAEIDDGRDDSQRGERMRLRELLGQDLNEPLEWPLSASNTFFKTEPQSR